VNIEIASHYLSILFLWKITVFLDLEAERWCGKLPGFGCRVRATGHKSFIVMYRAGGRNATPRKVTIADCAALKSTASETTCL
jgi:hypothetical protein